MRMKIVIISIIELNATNYPPLSRPEDILKIEEDNIKESSLDEYLNEDYEVKLELLD
jgi:hypothetical protein